MWVRSAKVFHQSFQGKWVLVLGVEKNTAISIFKMILKCWLSSIGGAATSPLYSTDILMYHPAFWSWNMTTVYNSNHGGLYGRWLSLWGLAQAHMCPLMLLSLSLKLAPWFWQPNIVSSYLFINHILLMKWPTTMWTIPTPRYFTSNTL